MSRTLFYILIPILVFSAAACAGEPGAESYRSNPGDTEGPIRLNLVADIGEQITSLAHAGDGSGRLFVTTRLGEVRIIQNGRLQGVPFLDLSEIIDSASIEQGLLSMAFDPDYARTGRFYLYYTNLATDNDTVVARLSVSENPDRANPASEERVLFLEQPANNHNGGQLKFGPDDMLYIGLGDGGKGNDPWGNGQNPTTLFGAILRLNVQGQDTYSIPSDNPFVAGDNGAEEIWVYGLRNPWRFSFDRLTGDLYIGDVGQNLYEEIHFLSPEDAPGANLGWNVMEGQHCFRPETDCSQEGLVLPIWEYVHGDDGCSVTGGYVYRGSEYPQLAGTYFFSDYCSGKIWGAQQEDVGKWNVVEMLDTDLQIVSFGEDEDGELYVLDFEGRVFSLEATPWR